MPLKTQRLLSEPACICRLTFLFRRLFPSSNWYSLISMATSSSTRTSSSPQSAARHRDVIFCENNTIRYDNTITQFDVTGTQDIVTSERAQRAERVLSYLRGKSEYSRPDPTRPGPITLFKALYLRNCMSDRQAVFFGEYHLDVKVVWHGYHIASVPVTARGAWQTWDTLDDPQNTLPQ